MKDFYDGLDKEQILILKDQISRFKKFKGKPRKQIIPKATPILPEGTLIHGTGFNKKVLENIAKTGIITGQYFGIEEDGETFFCADFHRINKDMTLEEYNKSFKYVDGRCPFGTRGKNTIAFILHPNEEMNEISKYDCYRDNTKESNETKSFVNEAGIPIEDKSTASSILFGVPSNFINGIVIGDNLINEENINLLKELFPNCYLVRNNGNIIYKQNDTEETTHFRINSILKDIELENKQKQIDQLNYTINKKEDDEEKLWKAIATLGLDQIAKVYEELHWQGDYLEFAKKLKEKYNIEGEKRI